MHEAARQHLVAEIKEAGRRSAKPLDCPRCGAPCLQGDDHDRAAFTVTVDRDPITLVDEMLAILDDRPTFDLVKATGRHAAGRHDLWYREPWHVHADRPPRYTIHQQHRCQEGATR